MEVQYNWFSNLKMCLAVQLEGSMIRKTLNKILHAEKWEPTLFKTFESFQVLHNRRREKTSRAEKRVDSFFSLRSSRLEKLSELIKHELLLIARGWRERWKNRIILSFRVCSLFVRVEDTTDTTTTATTTRIIFTKNNDDNNNGDYDNGNNNVGANNNDNDDDDNDSRRQSNCPSWCCNLLFLVEAQNTKSTQNNGRGFATRSRGTNVYQKNQKLVFSIAPCFDLSRQNVNLLNIKTWKAGFWKMKADEVFGWLD